MEMLLASVKGAELNNKDYAANIWIHKSDLCANVNKSKTKNLGVHPFQIFVQMANTPR